MHTTAQKSQPSHANPVGTPHGYVLASQQKQRSIGPTIPRSTLVVHGVVRVMRHVVSACIRPFDRL